MRRIIAVLAVVCLLVSSGCAALAVGAAGVAGVIYVRGEGRKVYDGDLESAFEVAVRAVRDLGIDLKKRTIDKTGAKIEAETALEDSVTVRLVRVTPKTTEIRIRVGTFWDKRVTDLIFQALDRRFAPPGESRPG